jgi:hypothetical protein
MNFEEAMDDFFDQYSVRERESVEADPYYQHAAQEENTAKAQAIASQSVPAHARRKALSELHHLNNFFKEFDI